MSSNSEPDARFRFSLKTLLIVLVVVGVGTGILSGYLRSDGQNGSHRLCEIAGSGLGGYIGAQLPDVFDPPCYGPSHRQLAHSIRALVGAGGIGSTLFTALEARCRELAEEAETMGNEFLAALFSALAGFFWGLAWGYISHIGLDAMTPLGIPL